MLDDRLALLEQGGAATRSDVVSVAPRRMAALTEYTSARAAAPSWVAVLPALVVRLLARSLARGPLGTLIFYADVVTDMLVIRNLFASFHPIWATLAFSFIIAQVLWSAIWLIFYIVHDDASWSQRHAFPTATILLPTLTLAMLPPLLLVALNDHYSFLHRWPQWETAVFDGGLVWLSFLASLPLSLDALLLLEPLGLLARVLPEADGSSVAAVALGHLRLLLPPYRATRMLIQAALEALPQSVLQAYILLRASGSVGVPDRAAIHSSPESIKALDLPLIKCSLLISLASLLKGVMEAQAGASARRIELREYMWLRLMGQGLPITAIHQNALTRCAIHVEISPNQLSSLCIALRATTQLTSLDLSHSLMQDAVAAIIGADVLAANVGLTELDLSHNLLGPECCGALADAIAVNTVLLSLSLEGNALCGKFRDSSGVTRIARALKVNATLTRLNLSATGLEADAAKEVAGALAANRGLTSLALGFNGLGHDPLINVADATVARAFVRALEENPTLVSLGLEGNPLGEADRAALREVAARRGRHAIATRVSVDVEE